MRARTIVRPGAGTVSLVAMLVFLVATLLLETIVAVPLRLPGHRALPGALALLLMAEVFTPLFLVGLSMIVPCLLFLVGAGEPQMVLGWLLPAVVIALASGGRWRTTIWFFLALGVAFGLARYLLLLPGLHRTAEILRVTGHLAFGGVGGLAAFGISRLGGGRRRDEGQNPG